MFSSLHTEVENSLSEALTSLNHPTDDLSIEQPPKDVNAVLSSSVAFQLASQIDAPPLTVAANIAAAIDPQAYDYIGSVATAGPYVNITPSDRYFEATLETATDGSYGRHEPTGKSVLVEHTSANPTGPFHVGRARNPIIGDAIVRLLEYAGHDVDTHYYINDAGRQIAELTWAYEAFTEDELPPPENNSPDYDLVRYYQKAHSYLEDAGQDDAAAAEREIKAILHGLEDGDEAVNKRVDEVVDTVLEGMQATLDRLSVGFDEFIKETQFMHEGTINEVVERLKGTDAAVRQNDAWQLEFETDIDDRVFQRADGTSLYITRDIAYHERKLATYDRAVTVLGEDHEQHAAQLKAALELLDNDTDRLQQVFYSWVTLPDENMSTREGTGIYLDDLLDEAIARARTEVEQRQGQRQRDDTLTTDDSERIARQVGIGAVRYGIVSTQPTKGITFDWEQALNFEAQSAPYVQYVHARACALLEEAATAENTPPTDIDAAIFAHPAERDLLEIIARFPAVVDSAAEDLHPHQIATFTREFAETFNAFYRNCPVLYATGETQEARLCLVEASRQTLSSALDILGIEAPKSM